MAKVSLAKLFDRVNEIDKTSQVAVMQSEDSLQISEKNRVDLERLIATLRVDGDFQSDTVEPDSSPQQSVADSSPSLDNTLQQSFANLTSSVEILRQDVDELYQAFYLSQQGRQNILRQEDRSLFKEEDALQKNIGKEKSGGLSKAMKRDPNKRQQDLEREVGKKRKAILKGLGLGLLSSFGMALGTGTPSGGAVTPGSPIPGGAVTPGSPIPDVSQDTEFIKEVEKLAKETGTQPSELMALYNAESGGIKTDATNPSGATGIFQLMFGGKFGDKRYGYTREQFKNLSRAEQVKIHRKYLEEHRFFEKGGSGITDVSMANIAPAFLGQDENQALYSAPSQEYEQNKNVDLIYGNKDGVISLKEYKDFILLRGNEEGFRQYNPKPNTTGPQSNLNPNSNFRPVVASQGLSLQPPLTANNITSINLPPQTINDGTSGQQQRGQARAEAPPSVHSTTNNTMFGNVIANRFLSVVV